MNGGTEGGRGEGQGVVCVLGSGVFFWGECMCRVEGYMCVFFGGEGGVNVG